LRFVLEVEEGKPLPQTIDHDVGLVVFDYRGASANSQLTLQMDHLVNAGQFCGEGRRWGSL
jgi:hypothetical protein